MLEQRQAALVEKFSLNTESVLRNLSQAIFFDPRKMFNPDGSVKRLIDLDDDTAMALSGFETIEMAGEVVATTKKVKWLDKNAARDQANKILGQYKEKLEITGDDQILKAIFSGRARAAQR